MGRYTTKQLAPRRGRAGLFGTMLVVMAIVGCDRRSTSSTSQPAATHATPPVLMSLAQLPVSYAAVSHVAQRAGFYTASDLDCRVLSATAGPDVVTALRSKANGAATAGTIAITPVVTMIAAGDTPVIVATTIVSHGQAKLATFAGTSITADPATLRGKRVGVTRNTNGDIYLSRLLAKGGLTEADATIVSGRPPELKAALVRGNLDAAILWDPFTEQAAREYRRLRTDGKTTDRGEPVTFVDRDLHTLALNIVTTRDKLNANHEAIVRLLRALILAESEFDGPRRAATQAELESWLGLESGDLSDFFASTEFHVRLDVPQTKRWIGEELDWFRAKDPSAHRPADLDVFVDPSVLAGIDARRVVK